LVVGFWFKKKIMISYRELDVWLEARKLVKIVYTVCKKFPSEELYGLTSQIKRCSISIPSNIAEGCGRQSSKETIHFLHISRGSLFELETQLYLASDLEFVSDEELKLVLIQVTSCKKLLNGFINYYKKC
jgi:four helix bundle protein